MPIGRNHVRKRSIYARAARWIAQLSGRPMTFLLAVAMIVVWLITGPIFGYSDTWQLVINTGTTIITFLMVFLIQNTQNRDTVAMQLKLDELIRATQGAHNALLDLEELDEQALETFRAQYEALAREAGSAATRAAPTPARPKSSALLLHRLQGLLHDVGQRQPVVKAARPQESDHLPDHQRVDHHEGMGDRQHQMVGHTLQLRAFHRHLAVVRPRQAGHRPPD